MNKEIREIEKGELTSFFFSKLNPMPFTEDAEKAVLCAAMRDKDVLSSVSASISAEMFHNPAHRMIFRTLCALHAEDSAVDFIAVKTSLKNAGKLEGIGGSQFLSELWDFGDSGSGWKFYSDWLYEYYNRRVGITEGLALVEELRALRSGSVQSGTARAIILESLERIQAKLEARIVREEKPFCELVDETLAEIEKRATSQVPTGIRFGLEKLDSEICGVQPGEVCVISGQTSRGKSALALQAVLSAAGQGKSVALFTLEMPGTQMVERMFSADGEISMKAIREGLFSKSDRERLSLSEQRLKCHPIHLRDDLADINGIVDRCRLLKTNKDIELVVVDYLQLVESGRRGREDTREREVADVSRKLKGLAMELKVSVIALSQLNDKGLLRESRAIGHDADIVLKIDESESEDSSDVDIVVEKHRSAGPGKRITVEFYGQYMRFQ
jgi:replicative DNA helicase